MSVGGIIFLAVLIGASLIFMGLLTWAERRTRAGGGSSGAL